MSILARLSSPTRDRSEYHNRKTAIACLEDPDLLEEIAGGLRSTNHSLLGDCAEVMSMVAQQQPEWVAAYDQQIAPLIRHPKTRVRWEAARALALIAPYSTEMISDLLPDLAEQGRQESDEGNSIKKLVASYEHLFIS